LFKTWAVYWPADEEIGVGFLSDVRDFFLYSQHQDQLWGSPIYWSNGLSVLLPQEWSEDEAEKALPIRAEVKKSWSNSSSVRHVNLERRLKHMQPALTWSTYGFTPQIVFVCFVCFSQLRAKTGFSVS
jgi:hypothetical protein